MPDLPKFGEFLLNLVLYPLRWIFLQVTDWLADTIQAITLPDWYSSVASFWSGVPSSVMYFAQWFSFGSGLTIIFAAFAVRFIIRRLPVVG